MKYVYALKMAGDHPYFYVGQTGDPVRRIKDHRCTFGKNVRLKVLETCSNTCAKTRESAWIKMLSDSGCKLINMNQRPYRDCDLPVKINKLKSVA